MYFQGAVQLRRSQQRVPEKTSDAPSVPPPRAFMSGQTARAGSPMRNTRVIGLRLAIQYFDHPAVGRRRALVIDVVQTLRESATSQFGRNSKLHGPALACGADKGAGPAIIDSFDGQKFDRTSKP